MLEKYQKLAIIIVGGGSGTRFGKRNKLLWQWHGKPILAYSIKTFAKVCGQLILVAPGSLYSEFEAIALAECVDKDKLEVVIGGASRSESVVNAIAKLADTIEFVAIHDAARPLATVDLLDRLLEKVEGADIDAAIPGKVITDTVKRIAPATGEVVETLDRSSLVTVQTPQLFKKVKLLEAYARMRGESFTDDSVLVEKIGGKVAFLENSTNNIKVTYPHDIEQLG